MPDREKVISGLHDIGGFIAGRIGVEQARNFLRTIDDAIDLLKEQDDMGKELTDAMELVRKKNERIEKLPKEQKSEIEQLNRFVNGFSRDAVPVVRCKDCENKECWGRAGDVVCGIDGTPHRPDWFCADGIAKDTDVLNK